MFKSKTYPIMIEYAKKILPLVSEWKPLFKKELMKCVNWAEPQEWFELRNWCYDNFYDLHSDILTDVYESQKKAGRKIQVLKDFGTNMEFNTCKIRV